VENQSETITSGLNFNNFAAEAIWNRTVNIRDVGDNGLSASSVSDLLNNSDVVAVFVTGPFVSSPDQIGNPGAAANGDGTIRQTNSILIDNMWFRTSVDPKELKTYSPAEIPEALGAAQSVAKATTVPELAGLKAITDKFQANGLHFLQFPDGPRVLFVEAPSYGPRAGENPSILPAEIAMSAKQLLIPPNGNDVFLRNAKKGSLGNVQFGELGQYPTVGIIGFDLITRGNNLVAQSRGEIYVDRATPKFFLAARPYRTQMESLRI